jgi:uncharacterized protein YajQ (UPF0234 family)
VYTSWPSELHPKSHCRVPTQRRTNNPSTRRGGRIQHSPFTIHHSTTASAATSKTSWSALLHLLRSLAFYHLDHVPSEHIVLKMPQQNVLASTRLSRKERQNRYILHGVRCAIRRSTLHDVNYAMSAEDECEAQHQLTFLRLDHLNCNPSPIAAYPPSAVPIIRPLVEEDEYNIHHSPFTIHHSTTASAATSKTLWSALLHMLHSLDFYNLDHVPSEQIVLKMPQQNVLASTRLSRKERQNRYILHGVRCAIRRSTLHDVNYAMPAEDECEAQHQLTFLRLDRAFPRKAAMTTSCH